MKKRKTFLIKFADFILKACRRRELRLYSSKYSKKTYTLHQHVVLLALREYFHQGYERFCLMLEDLTAVLDFLKLEKIPHFTTLQKVSQRLKGNIVENLLLGFASQANFRAGMDSTGMSCQHSTYYYEKRLEHFRKAKKTKPGRPRSKHKKKHQYNNLLVDLDRQLVLAGVFARGSKSDMKKLKPTLNKAKDLFEQMEDFDADKGYDSEYNHEFIQEQVVAKDYIKIKNESVPVHRTKGAHRKKAKRNAKNNVGRPRKNHRNKAETIMFVIKKVLGEHLTARKAVNQRQQMRFRLIAYNAYRKIKSFIWIEVFYKTVFIGVSELNTINDLCFRPSFVALT